jgi:uncharacterized SAM-binding protein YcdF (DUF218 family)
MNKVKIFYIILGSIIFIHSLIIIVFVSSFNFGTVIPLISGILLILSYFFEKSLFYKNNKKSIEKYIFIIKILFLVWLISFIILMFFVFNESEIKDDSDVDFIFVLGGGIRCNEPDNVLRERLDLAVDYSEKYPDLNIYVSGGIGIGEDISEAQAMENYLIDKGIDKNKIFKEEKATSTFENMKYLKDILLKEYDDLNDCNNMLLITSDFHMFRSKIIAKRLGFIPKGAKAKIPFYMYPNACLREYIAIFKTNILDY